MERKVTVIRCTCVTFEGCVDKIREYAEMGYSIHSHSITFGAFETYWDLVVVMSKS